MSNELHPDLPALPPRFQWKKRDTDWALAAWNTQYNEPNTWEDIGFVYGTHDPDTTYDVVLWVNDCDTGGCMFRILAENIATVKEASNYLLGLVQLGEAHFTFREEENERTK